MVYLIKNNIFKLYSLNKFFNIYLSYKKSLLYLKGFYGIIILRLPSYYFFFSNNNTFFSLLFLKKFFFLSFLRHFFVYYNWTNS